MRKVALVPTVTLTIRSRTTVPIEVGEAWELHPGSQVTSVQTGHDSRELVPATIGITALRGIVPTLARPVTVEEMGEAVAHGAAGVEQR